MLRLIARRASEISKAFDSLGISLNVQPKPEKVKVKLNLSELMQTKAAPLPDFGEVTKLIESHVSEYGVLPQIPKEASDLNPLTKTERSRLEDLSEFTEEYFDFRPNVGNRVADEEEENPEFQSYKIANLFRERSDDALEDPKYPNIEAHEHAYLDDIIAPINQDLYKVCPPEYLDDYPKWLDWQKKNEIPSFLDNEVKEEIEPTEDNLGPVTSGQATMGFSKATLDTYLSAPNTEELNPEIEDTIKDTNQSSHYQFGLDIKSSDEYGDFPENLSSNIEDAIKQTERWEQFTITSKVTKSFKKLEYELSHLPTPQPWKPVQLPSPLNYYETLPKWYKQQAVVWRMVVQLDRYNPDTPRKQKEKMINFLCYFLTPKSPKKFLFLQEYYAPKESMEDYVEEREALRAEKGSMLEDFIEEEEEEQIFTDDRILSEAEIAIKKIIGEDVVAKEGQTIYVDELPDYGIDWFTVEQENAKGHIPCPLTYYDNDDGYWDDWIREKRERIGMPELSKRTHFRH